ncbi:hypothetical protein HMPREF3213_01926 [Heyndrickxia coagulans]|uniref:Uncharacterized protein n=1 Tax=Heyndrickxia coagulans TaxID=1398 RepID=A0A133KPI5_HEYCO|nr:hypothetical protein HMPREF3213_01926 [Heyndrickxia coagulans]
MVFYPHDIEFASLLQSSLSFLPGSSKAIFQAWRGWSFTGGMKDKRAAATHPTVFHQPDERQNLAPALWSCLSQAV